METDYHYQLAYAAYQTRRQEQFSSYPKEVPVPAYWAEPGYSPLVGLIEGKIHGGYQPLPGADDLTSLLNDRQELLRSKIELTLLQLKERKELSQRLLYSMELDRNQLSNRILDLGVEVYFQTPRVMAWEMRQLDLERQKRMEESACFRDVTMLERDLKESLVEYLAEAQKQKLLKEA